MIEKYKQLYRTLGLNIAYYRKQRGLTQEQLAEKAGVERSRVSKTEIAWTGMEQFHVALSLGREACNPSRQPV